MPLSYIDVEAATGGIPLKQVFLKIWQNSQENTCVGVSFMESCNPVACKFMKKRLRHDIFP